MAAIVGLAQIVLVFLFPWLRLATPDTLPLVYVAVNILYSMGAAVAGGWVTVKIARKAAAATALGALILGMGAVSLVALRGEQPLWYAIAIPILGAGAAWYGGQLQGRRQSIL